MRKQTLAQSASRLTLNSEGEEIGGPHHHASVPGGNAGAPRPRTDRRSPSKDQDAALVRLRRDRQRLGEGSIDDIEPQEDAMLMSDNYADKIIPISGGDGRAWSRLANIDHQSLVLPFTLFLIHLAPGARNTGACPMFIGHFAVGFAAKRLVPRISLGTLFLSVQFVDLLWPTMLLLGWEHVRIDPGNTAVTPLDFYDYPITHSLLAAIGWAAGFGMVYFLLRRFPRGAWVVAAGVVSHWLLDALVHSPDLPLAPGGDVRIGLGLWNAPLATAVIEVGIYAVGVAIYLRSTAAGDRVGTYGLWSLVVFMLVIQISNYAGSPPPSETAVAWVGQSQWLLIAWAYWIDRHRKRA